MPLFGDEPDFDYPAKLAKAVLTFAVVGLAVFCAWMLFRAVA